MSEQEDNIARLLQRLELLLKRQDDFSREINAIKAEIYSLKDQGIEKVPPEPKSVEATAVPPKKTAPPEVIKAPPVTSPPPIAPIKKAPKPKGDLEKFIGENLISKIGILITIIGVAIGVKYSIENDLISPLTRIVLGYLAGFALLIFGFRLKAKYENYSSVLVSGALAILYFITFAAYDFYGLIPQSIAFAFMFLITGFGVVAALNYDRQIIALIGLVGAYAVPFLLSDGSGRVGILFSYMTIINIGILSISFKKDWKPLHYSAFGLSWIIYLSWYLSSYEKEAHFGLAFFFLAVFFAVFYATSLAYKLLKNKTLNAGDVILILLNAFFFYGLGYALLDGYDEKTEHLLGLFTLGNAMVHFAVSVLVYRKKMANKSLFYLIAVLVLTFITIAFPVQLDGNWVTLLWTAEAALLFWLGRTKTIPIYENLAYPLILLAFFSLLHDWASGYSSYYSSSSEDTLTLFFNINFLTSVLFTGALAFINYLYHSKNFISPFAPGKFFEKAFAFLLGSLLIISLYWAFRLEINNYWEQLYGASTIELPPAEGDLYTGTKRNYDLRKFRTIWILNYSLLFMTGLLLFNLKRLKYRIFGFISLGLTIFTLLIFLSQGLFVLGQLRDSYLDQTLGAYYKTGTYHITLRYISFILVALTVYSCYKLLNAPFMKWKSWPVFDLLLHIIAVWIASSELINLMDLARSEQSYKLGLSILWGIYALLLIVLGIWKKKKYLRIGAIVLFGITLIKLFFYDISHLNTIAKTIVFVALGVLLLLISFLYNKYKHIISDEKTNE